MNNDWNPRLASKGSLLKKDLYWRRKIFHSPTAFRDSKLCINKFIDDEILIYLGAKKFEKTRGYSVEWIAKSVREENEENDMGSPILKRWMWKWYLVVVELGKTDLFLGYNWLQRYNPIIDWSKPTLLFEQCYFHYGRIYWGEEEEKDVDWKGQILFVNRREDNDESNPKYCE